MSSESSEGRSSTKCEDVRAKVRPDIKKWSFGSKSVDNINNKVFEICKSGLEALVLIELNSVSCSVEKMQRSVILSTLNIGMECENILFCP